MGGSAQAGSLTMEEIGRRYRREKEGLGSPTLPRYDLYSSPTHGHLVRTVTGALEDSAYQAKFRASLAIPGLVSLYHVEAEGLSCGSTEHYTCHTEFHLENLADEIRRNQTTRGAFACSDVAKVAHESLKVLSAMHTVGYAHQNLRPENILFTPESELKLLDSPFLTGVTAYSHSLDRKQAEYLSPAQLAAFQKGLAKAPDNRLKSDVFALGLVLFEMSTLKSHQVLVRGGKYDHAALED
jgi:serine/threonine protein kinase